jgi:hypothetical protein
MKKEVCKLAVEILKLIGLVAFLAAVIGVLVKGGI